VMNACGLCQLWPIRGKKYNCTPYSLAIFGVTKPTKFLCGLAAWIIAAVDARIKTNDILIRCRTPPQSGVSQYPIFADEMLELSPIAF